MSTCMGASVLILGGAQQHCKLVEAAHLLGCKAIVVDYLPESPAKKIADEAYQIDVNDISSLVNLCKEKLIDGVVSGWLDPCQKPYVELCRQMDYPCYTNAETLRVMTDKELFKKACLEHGVGTVPFVSGTIEQALSELSLSCMPYPLFVKPVDSRGSRGQSAVYDRGDLLWACRKASKASSNGRIIIENLIKESSDVSITLFFKDGKPSVERLSDRLLGSAKDGLSNVCVGTVSPSIYTDLFFGRTYEAVVGMLRKVGVTDGPVFLQAFVVDNEFQFYDPGLRFPGGDYEKAVKAALGIDYPRLMVEFSLKGKFAEVPGDMDDAYLLGGSIEVIHDITVKPGRIEILRGVRELFQIEGVVSVACRYEDGDIVPQEANVERRLVEVNYLANDLEDALSKSQMIQDCVVVLGEGGNMKISSFYDAFLAWVTSSGVKRSI